MGRMLNFDQLARLEKHTYQCSNSSLLDPLMQKWWCWLVERCPMYIAPNLITVTGLFINVVTCLILIYYSPDAKQEVCVRLLLLLVESAGILTSYWSY